MTYERTDEGRKIYYTCLPGHGDAEGPCGHQHMSLGTAEACLYDCIRGQAVGAGWQVEDYGYNWMGWCVVEVHEGAEYSWERMWGTDEDGDTRHIQGEPHPGWSLWQGPGQRIGPRMAQVVELVEYRPGLLKVRVAERVGPHGSLMYGYAAVDRTLAAGLIKLTGCAAAASIDAQNCISPHKNHRHLVPGD